MDKTVTITVAASDQGDGALLVANLVNTLRGLGVTPGIVSDDVQEVLRIGYDPWSAAQELAKALSSAKRVDVVEQRRVPARLTEAQSKLLDKVVLRLGDEADRPGAEELDEIAVELRGLQAQLLLP